MRLTRTSVVAILVVAILGFVLLLVLRQQPSRTNDHQESTSSSDRPSIKPEWAAPPEPINPIRPRPFRERSVEPLTFRVLDLVTSRPVAGASVCRNATGVDVCSEHPTDANGRGLAALPEDCVPPCEVYVALPQALGGAVMKAVFPKPPATDIVIPLYARLVIQTTLPHLPSGEYADGSNVDSLWCVSWPAPQDAFKKELPKTALSELQTMYSTMPTIESHSKTTEGAVRYHESMRRIAGCDASKLICLREEVKPGSEHTFDLAFAGDVLISHYLLGFDWDMKARVQAVPGESRRTVLDQLEGRRLRLIVQDEQGTGVAGARVVVVTRWDLGPEAPQPDNIFFVFTPQGSNRRIAVRRRFMVTDDNGQVGMWMLGRGPGEIYASATKPGHVGAGMDVWSGVGVPNKGTFRIELKRAKQEWALLTREGRPLSNCQTIKVTDLEPSSLLGQIDYSTFSSDEAGRAPFEQLVPGHRYAIIAETSADVYRQEFTWVPGAVIAF